ncbi:unnamed protein product [Debaryomyces fabryi]|nr:unnamed protein product [Debaryomyces fabryi]
MALGAERLLSALNTPFGTARFRPKRDISDQSRSQKFTKVIDDGYTTLKKNVKCVMLNATLFLEIV